MATTTVTKTKCVIKFGEKEGSYTLSSLKPTASDASIFATAEAINELQELHATRFLKVIESEIAE